MMAPILVVDDSSSDLSLTQRALVQARIINPVFLFPSAEDCLLYFAGTGQHSGRKVPCLALIDLVMAPMSGVELLEQMKSLPAARGSVPIMLSGMADYRMIQHGYNAGAATFLLKPVSAEEIVRTLSRVTRLQFKDGPAGVELGILPGPSAIPPMEGAEPPQPGLGA